MNTQAGSTTFDGKRGTDVLREPEINKSTAFTEEEEEREALDSRITKENINMATLNYSVTEPALRSPVEEWQPHGKQSESTKEWWHLTAVVHDTAGNSYFLASALLYLRVFGGWPS